MTGRFCGQCGAPIAGRPPAARSFLAQWGAVGLAVLMLAILAVLILRQPQVPAAGPPDPAAGSASAAVVPPDISGLSPRQRFDTLYNVVMRASESGDAARSARFTPMALMAYADLEDVDADARYHAAVLRLHVNGDYKPALLLADTIQASAPQHLFAFMIRGLAGQLAGDQAMVRAAARGFLSAWEREIASGKPEYQDHRIMLDQFRARALKSDSARKL
ncbi:MAG TPA: hypothetical protein VLB12_11605 [Gemmatimonadales bacterium]|nr:hypothetical protein [Gemmatimonadales bacterium]